MRLINLNAVPEAEGITFEDVSPGHWLLEHVAFVPAGRIVVGSPVIRSVAAFFVRVLKPPQPMCVCASVEEATAFAEERCQSVRDWSAKEAG